LLLVWSHERRKTLPSINTTPEIAAKGRHDALESRLDQRSIEQAEQPAQSAARTSRAERHYRFAGLPDPPKSSH
jgi:hypothetical protein